MNIKKVLVSDHVHTTAIEKLTDFGVQVDCEFGLSKDLLIKKIADYDALIVRSKTKVDKDVIEAAKQLKVVGRAGVGVDNIDVDACTARGIVVLNSRTGNVLSAAELTCALILNLLRNVIEANDSIRDNKWNRELYVGNEAYGKVLGIIGMGHVGQKVAERMEAFGMHIFFYDPLLPSTFPKRLYARSETIEDLCSIADIITLHTPLLESTRKLVNAKFLKNCKQGVKIINTARGELIDEKALLDALMTDKCSGAALDVFEVEPPVSDITKQLIAHSKVVATPHLGSGTIEAQIRVGVDVAEQFLALNKVVEYSRLDGIVNP